jgi:hypothetical protein
MQIPPPYNMSLVSEQMRLLKKLATKGIAFSYQKKRNHIITSASEHKLILDTCKYLERLGFKVTFAPIRLLLFI